MVQIKRNFNYTKCSSLESFQRFFIFQKKKKKKKLFREYFTLCVKIGIFRLGESPCKMEAGPKGSTNETIPFKRVIDGERLANRYLDYSSYLRSILGRPIILYHMLAFKCALCKNNYATPRLADVRFHVYATRPIKRPFAVQIIADAPMHSLCTLFFLFPLSLRVGGERESTISAQRRRRISDCALISAPV